MSQPNPRTRRSSHGLLRRSHLGHGCRRQHAAPALEQGLRKKRQIAGGGKHSRIARHAAHPAGRGVVHHAAQQAMVLIVFSGSDARFPRMRRDEARLFHSERRKNVFRGIFVERFAGEPLDQRSQHHEADVAINKRRARSPFWSLLERHPIRRFFPFPLLRQIQIGSEARVMHQQLADRNVLLAVLPELGKVLGDRVAHAKLSLLPKLHDGRGGRDDLCKGRAIEYCIQRHRLPPRLNRAAAVSFAINHRRPRRAWPTTSTAPGICPCAMASLTMGSRTARREASGVWAQAAAENKRAKSSSFFSYAFHVCCDST